MIVIVLQFAILKLFIEVYLLNYKNKSLISKLMGLVYLMMNIMALISDNNMIHEDMKDRVRMGLDMQII